MTPSKEKEEENEKFTFLYLFSYFIPNWSYGQMPGIALYHQM